MPRDITHFLVAKKVCQALQCEPFWQSSLHNQNCVKLGSVFHDALYYLLKPNRHLAIRELPDKLHGANGEDTYIIIKNIVRTFRDSAIKDQLLAFLLGLVSHIFTDISFHPMVYFLTGNVYDIDHTKKDQAIWKHRKIEALIDVYFCGEMNNIALYSLSSYLRGIETDKKIVFAEVTKGLFPEEIQDEVAQSIVSAYRTFASIQTLCIRKIPRRLLSGLAMLPSPHLKAVAALLYTPALLRYVDEISGTISYRNPLSGDEYTTTLQTLFDQSVSKSIDFCKTLEKILKEEMTLDMLPVGPCLELAISGVIATEMRYFSPKEFFS